MTDTGSTNPVAVPATVDEPVVGGEPALVTDRLSVRFGTAAGPVHALSQVSLRLRRGETLVVAGESGSGKSVLAAAILRTLPGNATITGTARIGGTSLAELAPPAQRQFRRRHIAYIPQSPATALNPVRRVGSLLTEVARARGLSGAAATAALEAALAELGLDFTQLARRYPHQLSGGMQQRLLNALAMIGDPVLAIADEPTSGLDPDLVEATAAGLRRLAARGAGLLVITHDLRLARRLGGRLALLYGSHLVEFRPTERFFEEPAHPYGQGLLAAMPERGSVPIPGSPPELTALPPGCPFLPRCQARIGACEGAMPEPVTVIGDGTDPGWVRCHRHGGSGENGGGENGGGDA